MSETMFSPEYPVEPTIIPETQVSQETLTNSSDSDESENNTVCSRRQNSIVNNVTKLDKRTSGKKKSSSSRMLESDALEGTSWMYDSEAMEIDDAHNNSASTNDSENEHRDQREEEEREQGSSPVSSLSAEQRRKSSSYFRVPELPKNFRKSAGSRLNVFDNYGTPNSSVASTSNAMNPTSR